jgi:hypothetical protein
MATSDPGDHHSNLWDISIQRKHSSLNLQSAKPRNMLSTKCQSLELRHSATLSLWEILKLCIQKLPNPKESESRSPEMFKDKVNPRLIRKKCWLMTLGVWSSEICILCTPKLPNMSNLRSGLSSFIAYFEVFKRRQTRNVKPVKGIIFLI